MASGYLVAALSLLILGWPGYRMGLDDLFPAILMGLPWSLSLKVFQAGQWSTLGIVTASIALNSILLWSWALRRKKARPPPTRNLSSGDVFQGVPTGTHY